MPRSGEVGDMADTYFMFVDASGDPGPFRGENTRFYVLSGLILMPEKWYEAYNGILDIISRFFPRIDLTRRPELHMNHLRRGKGIYGRLNRDQRRQMADAIYNLIEKIEPIIISIVVDKEKYFARYTKSYPVKHTSFHYLMDRYERFLSRRASYGILIYDYEGKRDRDIRNMLEESRLIGSYNYRFHTRWQYERIVETIFFTESETSIGLQLADFVAYAIFACYEKKYCERFNQLQPFFDKSPSGSIENYGLKVIPGD